MCRQNQLRGLFLLGGGLGMLFALVIGGGFWAAALGVALVAGGVLLVLKK